MASSWFEDVTAAPAIEVFALSQECAQDPNPSKVNLSVGAYRDDDGKPWVLPVVRMVESSMAADSTLNHEYLPVPGTSSYLDGAMKLLLGEDSPAITQGRSGGIQGIGGTGALRIGMDYLKSQGFNVIYASKPTWGNHNDIARELGYDIRAYNYWDNENRTIDFTSFKIALMEAPEKSVILLHMCAHNPTGIDPSQEQWKELAAVIRERKLFPFFDCAYQGFASGDLDNDAWAVRYFVQEGFELFAAQSFSKNFGLYNERVGCLTFVCAKAEYVKRVQSQMVLKVRRTWSNSPNHGSRIVDNVLKNPSLCAEWKEHVKMMAERVLLMRERLMNKLRAQGTPGNWSHITAQSGMFSYTGLSVPQCQELVKKYHVYLLKSGRINMCGLTTKNVDYVAECIHKVVTETQASL